MCSELNRHQQHAFSSARRLVIISVRPLQPPNKARDLPNGLPATKMTASTIYRSFAAFFRQAAGPCLNKPRGQRRL